MRDPYNWTSEAVLLPGRWEVLSPLFPPAFGHVRQYDTDWIEESSMCKPTTPHMERDSR